MHAACVDKISNSWLTKIALLIFIIFIIVEVLFSSIYIGEMPLRSYLLVLAFCTYASLILRYKHLRNLLKEKAFLTIVIIFILLSFLIFVTYLWNNGSIIKCLIYLSKFLVQPFMIFFATYIFFILYGHKSLLKFFLGLISISAVVAIFQYFHIDLFWALRFKFGLDPDSAVRTILLSKERPVGLAQYYIPLAYQIICFYPFIFYFISLSKRKTYKWFIIFIIVFFGLFATGTRSAFLGMIIGLCILYFTPLESKHLTGLTGKEIRRWVLLSLLSVLLISAGFSVLNFSKYNSLPRMFRIGQSAWDKPKLFSFYCKKIIKDTIRVRKADKVPGEQFKSQEEKIPLGASLTKKQFLPERILPKDFQPKQGSHNQFLNTSLSYGILGLIILLFYYAYLWKLCSQGGLFFCKAGIISYLIHSFFHNAGPFVGDYIWWHICAFIVYSAVFRTREENSLGLLANLSKPSLENKVF